MTNTEPTGLQLAEAALQARAGETEIELRLDATLRACELLGDIHRAAPVIMIAGTNGKTSTARMIDALLSAHDLRVGRFSSPHLHSVTERISVDSAPVSEDDFVRVFAEIRPFLDIVDAELAGDGRPPLTYFEALTVLAFAVFADAPVDVYVLEVGMGGQWDSTNVADAEVCGFTHVSLDHQAFLGDTLTDIAATKAGILDRTQDDTPAPTPVAVIGNQDDEAAEELESQLAGRGLTGRWFGREFEVLEAKQAVDGQLFSMRGAYDVYSDLFLPLLGRHQIDNAALAVAIVEQFLGTEDKPLNTDTIGTGLSTVNSPGRMEVMRSDPTIVVDGAHNPDAAIALREALADSFDFSDVVAVVAVYEDKDVHGVLEHLYRTAGRVVVSQAQSPRALSSQKLAEAAEEWWDPDDVIRTDNLNDALMRAVDLALEDPERRTGIVVTGSLSTVAEARTLLGRKDAQ